MRKPTSILPILTILLLLTSAVVLTAGDKGREEGHHNAENSWVQDGAYLGVQIEADSDTGEGALITEVIPGSPAEHAGLQSGDLVQEMDGESVDDAVALAEKIRELNPGATVTLQLLRDGRVESIDVELGERHSEGRFVWKFEGEPLEGRFDSEWIEDWTGRAEEMAERFQQQAERMQEQAERQGEEFGKYEFEFNFGRPRLGVTVMETTPELREHLGGARDRGVLVGKVLPDSPAYEAGLEVGDLILSLDGEPVRSEGALRRSLAMTQETTITIEVLRDGRALTLTAELPEAEEHSFGPEASLHRKAARQLREDLRAQHDDQRIEQRQQAMEFRQQAEELRSQSREQERQIRQQQQEAVEQYRSALEQKESQLREQQLDREEQQHEAMEQYRHSLDQMRQQREAKRATIEII